MGHHHHHHRHQHHHQHYHHHHHHHLCRHNHHQHHHHHHDEFGCWMCMTEGLGGFHQLLDIWHKAVAIGRGENSGRQISAHNVLRGGTRGQGRSHDLMASSNG